MTAFSTIKNIDLILSDQQFDLLVCFTKLFLSFIIYFHKIKSPFSIYTAHIEKGDFIKLLKMKFLNNVPNSA